MTIYSGIIFGLMIIYTFYMGYNDGSVAVATTVATRAAKPGQAIIVGAITKFIVPIALYFLGFMSVATTISEGIIHKSFLIGIATDKAFMFILCGMIAAMIWGLITLILNLPSSTSHILMGGLLGSGIAAFGFSSVFWSSVLIKIVLMVFLAPIIGLLLGFFVMKLVMRCAARMPIKANRFLPLLQRINMVVLAGSFSANNVPKALGVYLLAIICGLTGGVTELPVWMVVVFSAALTVGMLSGGLKIVNTVGRKITKLSPIHSVAAQLSTNIVVIIVSAFGIPVSTSQIMSTSIMGVGASQRMSGVHWQTAGKIVSSWIITLPVVTILGACMYLLIGKLILGL